MSSEKRAPVSLALVHWPIYDRAGDMVATNVTNFDIHDIARASRVYGIQRYYIVHRLQEQLMYVSRVLEHWKVGPGSVFNPKRRTALTMVHLQETLDKVIEDWGCEPLVVATDARDLANPPEISFKALREEIFHRPERPVLVVFGTGFGLHADALKLCHVRLEPIRGAPPEDYRHLSVRSAVSICLDRLLGEW